MCSSLYYYLSTWPTPMQLNVLWISSSAEKDSVFHWFTYVTKSLTVMIEVTKAWPVTVKSTRYIITKPNSAWKSVRS